MTIWLNTPMKMQFRVIDGLTVRFAQSHDREDHALLLSPWPESLLAFEPVWTRLAEHTHLVAIDLPGFGQYRLPAGVGPSLKTWPRWLPQRRQTTSVRRMNRALPGRSSTASATAGWPKLGQPVPE